MRYVRGQPITLDDIRREQERMSQASEPLTIVISKEMYDKFTRFENEAYGSYKKLPWYRKLIYRWNMWRTKV